MKIEINNVTKEKIETKLLVSAADIFNKKFNLGRQKEISVALVGERRMRSLNKKYRQADKITDVLSFADSKDKDFLGEIIICYPQIKHQAKRQKISIKKELTFIFIHGLLHLIGYNDKTERGHGQMMKLGEELCKSVLDKK